MQSAVPWISEPAAVAGFALATSINLGRGLNLRSPSFRGATRSGGRPIPDPICQKSVRPAVHNVTCRAGPFQLVCAYGDKADSPDALCRINDGQEAVGAVGRRPGLSPILLTLPPHRRAIDILQSWRRWTNKWRPKTRTPPEILIRLSPFTRPQAEVGRLAPVVGVDTAVAWIRNAPAVDGRCHPRTGRHTKQK